VEATAERLFVLKGDGLVRLFDGSYSEVRQLQTSVLRQMCVFLGPPLLLSWSARSSKQHRSATWHLAQQLASISHQQICGPWQLSCQSSTLNIMEKEERQEWKEAAKQAASADSKSL
jgi:hypothetical protein